MNWTERSEGSSWRTAVSRFTCLTNVKLSSTRRSTMSAKRILVISILALFCFSPLQGPISSYLQDENETFHSPPNSHEILMMGNSYIGSNSLGSIVDGVMNDASIAANVTSLSGGGMRLPQHYANVATAGHQWNTTLNNGAWDWVILQDQSQVAGFSRTDQYWIDSKDAAIQLAQSIDAKGADSVLMMTWGRRDGDSNNAQRYPDFSTMQDELEAGYLDYRDNMSSQGNVWVAPVGLAFEHIHDKIIAQGGTPTNSGNLFYDLYSGDGSHPSLAGSYLAALVIFSTISGDTPVGLSHSTSLTNSVVLELQQAAAATVFNETSHLDYPWQSNTQNQLPPINLSAIPDGALAFEWVEQNDRSNDMDITIDAISVNSSGTIFAAGTSEILSTDTSFGICNLPQDNLLFVVKLHPNGHCSWAANVSVSGAGSVQQGWTMNSITHDYYGNSYVVGNMMGSSSGQPKTYSFGQNISFTLSSSIDGKGFIGKLNPQGEWQWVKTLNGTATHYEITGIDANMQGDIVVTGRYGLGDEGPDYSDTGTLEFDSITLQSGMQRSIFVASIDSAGIWQWAKLAGFNHLGSSTSSAFAEFGLFDSALDSSGDNVIIGYYKGDGAQYLEAVFGSHTLATSTNKGLFVAKINSNGVWQWAQKFDSHSSSNYGYSIDSDSNDDIFIAGEFYGDIVIDSTTLSAGGNSNCFVAKLLANGTWDWMVEVDSDGSSCYSIVTDVHDNAIVSGKYSSISQFGGTQLFPAAGGNDIFLAKINGTGDWKFAIGFGTNSADYSSTVYSDRSGDAYIAGNMASGTANYGSIQMQNPTGKDWFIGKLTSDYDADGEADSNDVDDDGDYIIDIYDKCPYSPIGFESIPAFDYDSDGCRDSDEDDDDDDDGLNDLIDNCSKGMTGWTSTNLTDLDGDGCLDALEDFDDDADGFEDFEDFCQRIAGNSTMEFEKGCPDSDGDGRPDILDPFDDDPGEWSDKDGDGMGDNSDVFPLDATQQFDNDSDGFGDEEYGNGGDSCPTIFGTSTIDRKGCIDSDGDGWSDEGDDFPNDPTLHLDTDGDTIPDYLDDFPFDPTQQTDSDGDGYGDNASGNLGDVFPNDPNRQFDSDRDGVDDNADVFPFDPTQWQDFDGDGYGDNPLGIGADKFPEDSSQWNDIDGDGYGDNQSGSYPDAFFTDATQWSDIDGDGYGDNPSGRLFDLFPNDATQWQDADGDGLGDNQSGDNADPYLNDFDNDGYNDTIDILPRFSSPGDLDADGCLDDNDAFPANALECFDTDGDGIGNNADSDDDGDEWTDADEERAGTDPLDSSDTPVDSFEIVIPGTSVGLGAWDLIGMFGGIPIFAWLAFGFVTRNARCTRFEQELEMANSRESLEAVALRWEYSLMLRLIGPHQGIRLERIRSELDDKFENAENMMITALDEPMTEVDQTPIVEAQEKMIPEIITSPAIDAKADQIDDEGYSWLNHNGVQWYRSDEESQWIEFEN